jgi:hypothetical protein
MKPIGIVSATEDLHRIESAIEQILWTKQHLKMLVTKAGLGLTGIRL